MTPTPDITTPGTNDRKLVEAEELCKIQYEQIAQRDFLLAEKTDLLDDLQQEIDAQAALIAKKSHEIKALTEISEGYRIASEFAVDDHKMGQHTSDLAQLRRAIIEQSDEIQAMRKSTSWRVTAPLRRVKLALSGRSKS